MYVKPFGRLLFLLIVLKLSACFKKQHFISDDSKTDYERAAAKCILNIAKSSFAEKSVIIISTATGAHHIGSKTTSIVHIDRLMIEDLFREVKWTIYINKAHTKLTSIHTDGNQPDNYILQLRNVMEFKQNFYQLKSSNSWNPHAKFIIQLNIVSPNFKTFISFFIQTLWKHWARNAIILIHDYKDPLHLFFYTWYPFIDGHCGDEFNDPSIVGECYAGNITSGNILYPEKIPTDLNGCPIRAQTYDLPPYIILPQFKFDGNNVPIRDGLEVLLLNVIAKQMNFSVVFKVARQNSTLEYALIQVNDLNADIVVGAIAPDNQRHDIFDYTQTYWDESITWYVPASTETPQWKNFIFSFELRAWIIISFGFLLCSFSIRYLSRKNPDEPQCFKEYGSTFLWLYSLLLSLSSVRLPRATKTRVVFLAWILFAFIVNVTFQSFLMSVLTKPTYEKQLETFDELLDSNLDLGIIEMHERFYREDPKYVKILNTTYHCVDIGACLYNVFMKRSMGVALPRLYMAYNKPRYLDSTGRPLIYEFDYDIVSYPIEMLVRKGFPMLHRFDVLILQLKEIGLMQKWRDDYLRMTNMERELVVDNEEQPTKSLSFHQIKIIFLILGIGLMNSSLVFAVEVIWNRYRKTRPKRNYMQKMHFKKLVDPRLPDVKHQV